MTESTASYQLVQSMLSVKIEPDGRRLVRIPVHAVVRCTGASAVRGFVEVAWRGSIYLVFEEDLNKQRHLSDKFCNAET